MYEEPEYFLYFDGCCKGNPGPAGAGSVLYRGEFEISSKSEFVGSKETNNVAEYCALIMGLKDTLSLGVRNITVRCDNLLIIKQITGKYKVNSSVMMNYYDRVIDLAKQFKYIDFEHIPREKNKRADQLANIGLLSGSFN
jgi:ribonuclease HI